MGSGARHVGGRFGLRWLIAFAIVGLLSSPMIGSNFGFPPVAVVADDDEGDEDDGGGVQGGDAGSQGEGGNVRGENQGQGGEGGNSGRGGGDEATADATDAATAVQIEVERGTATAEAEGTATAQGEGRDDGGGEAVAPVETYRVEVECAYAEAEDQTSCTFVGVADGGGVAVRRIALPVTAICAPVVGGDPAFVTADAESRIPGGRAAANREALRLVLAGRVTTDGAATYWVTTDSGLVPGRGPNLACEAQRVPEPEVDDFSDSTGAIVVQALACGEVADAATFDWFGACPEPAEGAEFALEVRNGAASEPQATGTVAEDGRLRFRQLPPGAYQLTQTNATWCHAESDSVNAQGEVLVEAGQRASVWIFNCTRDTAEATATPAT